MKKMTRTIIAIIMALVMIPGISSTAFAAESTLQEGTYNVNVTLYKENKTDESMGNRGITNPCKLTVYNNGTCDFEFYTHKFTYLFIPGYLKEMTLDGKKGVAFGNDPEYNFKFTVSDDNNLPLSDFKEGNYIEGKYTANAGAFDHKDKVGYLKINSITAAS